MNKERLLNVAKALRESPVPDRFTMKLIAHDCNTPACALGHYAARADLQDVFYLTKEGDLQRRAEPGYGVGMSKAIREHFGITEEQDDELFDARGCGRAKTPIEAAAYIEHFVADNS